MATTIPARYWVPLCMLISFPGIGLAAAAAGAPREVAPARNTPRPDVVPGKRPYEMLRAGRKEARPPLVGFEDLEGWTVEMFGGAVASFERSQEAKVWGEFSGKLTYRGRPGENRVVLRPPRPLPIPGRFTAANLWCWGNNWGWAPRPETPQVALALLLADARGAVHRVSLGQVRWEEWWLVHRRVANHLGPAPAFPFALAGIEVTGGHQSEDRTIFLDSLSFYEEEWPALTFEPRPRRNLQLFPGQDPGLNTGPGRLPFPTREETILPENLERDFENEIVEDGEGRYTLRYRGPDGEVAYRLAPGPGLGAVEVLLDGRRAATALAGAGVRLDGRLQGASRWESLERQGDEVRALVVQPLEEGEARVELAYRIWQKSLVADVFCRGGGATALELGALEDVERPQAIPVPYANYGGQSHVLLGWSAGRPFFASLWIDWYRSNGSELFTRREVSRRRAVIAGGVRYRPKTDGRRNDLFERFFLTLSPLFEETLPTIANPPARWGEAAGECLWQETWGPADFRKEHERSRRLRAYGIEKLIQLNHEIAWRDNADSFTLRIHAAPGKGGDEALAEYVGRQKSLGWRSGLYTNYTDFAPVNENWDENAVQLEPDREWRRAWPRCYALKPARAVELDARYAPAIKKRYDPDAAYTDVHTAAAPWHYCDYDARVPGAGTFAATIYAYGEILLNDSKVYGGPVFSEGTYQCLYAGLPDGNYALHYGGYDFARDPILPQFDLLKIHPLSVDIGMGWTTNFCRWPGWNDPENLEASIDRFLLATMAYGHIGWLVEESYGMRLVCRSYYTLQPLAKRYALVRPRSIEYFDGERLVSSSAALASGAYRESQLRVVYRGGLELWLNGSWKKTWRLPAGAGGHELPPAGWLAREPRGGFFAFSALRDGTRCDWVLSPDFLYADGRGTFRLLDLMALRGGAAIRAPGPDRLEIVDIGGNGEIGFGGVVALDHLPPDHLARRVAAIREAPALEARAFGAGGEPLGEAQVRRASGRFWLIPMAGGVRYEIRRARRPLALRLAVGPDAVEVVAGDAVRIQVRAEEGLRLAPDSVRARSGGEEMSLEGKTAREGDLEAALRVPRSEKKKGGEALWVEIEGAVAGPSGCDLRQASGWLFLVRREPQELRFSPGEIPLAGGRGEAVVSGRLGLPGRVAVLELEPPPWLQVVPARLEGSGPVEARVSLAADEPRDGVLSAVVRCGGAEERIAFELAAGEGRREVVRLDDGSVPFSWGHSMRGGGEEPGGEEVGATFRREEAIGAGGVSRPGFFSHPPYRGGVGYTFGEFAPLVLPEEPCELHLYVGLKDGGDPSDGVVFTVEVVREDRRRLEILRERTAERSWREVTADLAAFRGERIVLRFVADVGPEGNSTADWASWAEPAVRLKRPVPVLRIRSSQ